MIAITTNNSIRVNPARREDLFIPELLGEVRKPVRNHPDVYSSSDEVCRFRERLKKMRENTISRTDTGGTATPDGMKSETLIPDRIDSCL
jgi:hypothetical protein